MAHFYVSYRGSYYIPNTTGKQALAREFYACTTLTGIYREQIENYRLRELIRNVAAASLAFGTLLASGVYYSEKLAQRVGIVGLVYTSIMPIDFFLRKISLCYYEYRLAAAEAEIQRTFNLSDYSEMTGPVTILADDLVVQVAQPISSGRNERLLYTETT